MLANSYLHTHHTLDNITLRLSVINSALGTLQHNTTRQTNKQLSSVAAPTKSFHLQPSHTVIGCSHLAYNGSLFLDCSTANTVTTWPPEWHQLWSLLNPADLRFCSHTHSPCPDLLVKVDVKNWFCFRWNRIISTTQTMTSIRMYSTNYWLPFMSSAPDWVMWFFKVCTILLETSFFNTHVFSQC